MWKNLPLKPYVYFSIALNLASAAIIVGVKTFLPPVVPLFYGLPSGANQLVSSWELLIAPATGLLITAINVGLTTVVKDPFFKKTLVIGSAFVSVLTTITALKIVALVGFF